jgi:hypothetical protein
MTGNLDSRKYRLIQEIMKIDQEADLSKLEDEVEALHGKDDTRFLVAVKPIRKSASLEELIAEQNYQPISKVEFFQKTSELGIEESLEELLAMLDS